MEDFTASVSETIQLGPDVLQLTLDFDQPDFAFAPGQYVSIDLSPEIRRSYSIASAPQRPSSIQLCIRLGDGPGSAAVRSLGVGHTVPVRGPYGNFLLPANEEPVTLIAGDTGIAPARSMVLHLGATGDARAVSVLYEPRDGVLLFAADFEPLGRSGAIFYERGEDIGELIARNAERLAGSRIMVSGFGPFLDRVAQALSALEIPEESIVVESFD